MVTDVRSNEFTLVREAVRSWAAGDEAIVAVGLIGSWARGEPTMDSDVDVVVLTSDTHRFVDQEEWVGDLCGHDADLVRTAEWGPVTERRVRLRSGLEIEFGFVEPFWADVDPVDPGTEACVTGGCIAWHDPQGLFSKLLRFLVL